MDYIACFDIGGTFIKYGLIDRDGQLHLKDKVPTPKENLQTELPEVLTGKIRELTRAFPLTGIGISSCGLVDCEKGEILFSSNLKGYSGMKLAKILTAKTNLPVSVENDVKSACYGEMWKGAIKGKKNVVFLTLGTGIGSAIIIDGKVVNGSGNLAGELGHTVIVDNGRPCSCGRKGCYERYAATSVLVQDYIEKKQQNSEVIEHISGEEIIALVARRDPLAVAVYEQFIHYICVGLANVTHLLNPEAIVIGGGIAEQGDQFFAAINNGLKQEIMPLYHQDTLVFPSALGNLAGLYGACYLTLKKFKHPIA
ncbi:ROK family protein [Neobacillus sp. YIM B02564]|uniref:ROK family protein n=1 Tax=Neobacillus paridis TaxID=2803862 RepID=A0ABS1TTX4_9BACI|nr:ROK family protein [Neobacillus paridis]MBL4954633.1 ROK family protein [Neobacillus paridis]